MSPRPHTAQPERTLSGGEEEVEGQPLTLRLCRYRGVVYPELAEGLSASGKALKDASE